MKELSLNVLDIVQNSIAAGATHVSILLVEDESGLLTLKIVDDGCGMSAQTIKSVVDPFFTTRTTRRVGMGIPLLKLAAEQAGGNLLIQSTTSEHSSREHGTTVVATFDTKHIDFTPLGDMVSTICTIIQGHPEVDYYFLHRTPRFGVTLDTVELRAVLGNGISLATPDVLAWISEYLLQQYRSE